VNGQIVDLTKERNRKLQLLMTFLSKRNIIFDGTIMKLFSQIL